MLNTAPLSLGGVHALVEYEHIAGEAPTHDCPGTPEMVCIVGVIVAGQRIDDPESVLSAWQLEQWQEQLLEH